MRNYGWLFVFMNVIRIFVKNVIMKERLQLLLQKYNLSASKLAELIDVQPSGISHILSGRNNPSMDFVIKCLNAFPEINPEWFIMGAGSMYKANSDSNPNTTGNPNSQPQLNAPKSPEISADDTKSYSNTNSTSLKTLYNKQQNTAVQIESDLFGGVSVQPKLKPAASHNPKPISNIKKISKVMIFYSDHTVESFEYSE